jgi:citrate lyase synthetase
MSYEYITVKELFESELSAVNNYIVLLENQDTLDEEQQKQLEKLKVVAEYLIDRLDERISIGNESGTMH